MFRTLNMSGLVINNVLFLELVVSRLRELTYLEDVGSVSGPGEDQGGWKEPEEDRSETAEAGQSVYEDGAVTFQGERVSTSKEIPRNVKGETNTEIPQKNTTEIQSSKYYNPIQSYQSTEEQFKEQIDFDVIWIDRPSDRRLLENIVSIAVDVLTSTAGTIRINREDKPVPIVQNIYGRLDKCSVEYVLESIRNCGSRIRNIRALLMTALYNATMTAASNVANLFAHHTALAQV